MDYLSKGGKAFIVATYTEDELCNFYSIVRAYNITLTNALVCEQDKNYYTQYPLFLLPNI